MQVKEMLFGIPVLFFIVWIFAAPMPEARISRVCEPINWIGNVATSTTALSAESHTATTARWSDKLNYSCKYAVWRLFYQEDYNKAVAAGLITPTQPANPSGVILPASGNPAQQPVESGQVKGAEPKSASTGEQK